MSDPEPDWAFRERVLRLATEADRDLVMRAKGKQLDALGRKYNVFRTGVPLKGFDGFKDDVTWDDA